MLSKHIQSFLNIYLKKYKLSKKEFAINSSISYTTICDLLNASKPNTSLETIVKIADYFEVSVDLICNRRQFISNKKIHKFRSTDILMTSLKNYIETKLLHLSLKPSKLSIELGFSSHALTDFLNISAKKNTLGTKIIIALANYFNSSIDEMIGRV